MDMHTQHCPRRARRAPCSMPGSAICGCVAQPYDALGAAHGLSGAQVRAVLQRALDGGQASRVGGVFGVGAGGEDHALRALRAGRRSGSTWHASSTPNPVSTNYVREHAFNMWFVATATDDARLHASVPSHRRRAGQGSVALRLPMRRAYRIDLGFDLDGADDAAPQAALPGAPVSEALRPLAARLEQGLALVERPFAALGEPLNLAEADVIAALADWCERGTLRRLGVVLRGQ